MTWTLMAPREVEGLTVKVFNIDGEAVESIALPRCSSYRLGRT